MSNFHARGMQLCANDKDRSRLIYNLLELLREADSTPAERVEVDKPSTLAELNRVRTLYGENDLVTRKLAGEYDKFVSHYMTLVTCMMKRFTFDLTKLNGHWIEVARDCCMKGPQAVEAAWHLAGLGGGSTLLPDALRPVNESQKLLMLGLGWNPVEFLKVITSRGNKMNKTGYSHRHFDDGSLSVVPSKAMTVMRKIRHELPLKD